MPELRFFCPQCLSTLKLHHAAPEGKKIKCPRCHAISPFPIESAVTVSPGGGSNPAGRGLPTPMPMRASSLKHTVPTDALNVEPMDDEESGPPVTATKAKQKKKAFDAVPWFVILMVLAYAGGAAATYLGYLDDQWKSIFLPK